MSRIYVSGSTQDWNQYAGGGTGVADSEEHWMQILAAKVCEFLAIAGHTPILGGIISAGANADEANRLGVDRYVAIHSNAGGGRGTEVWAYRDGTQSAVLARAIYARLAPETDSPDRGVKFSTGYIETSKPDVPACIVEVAFHDNPIEADEIRTHLDVFALRIAQGICDVLGGTIPLTPPVPPVVTPPPADPHPSDANEQIAAYEAREDKALGLARELVTLFTN